MSATPQPPAPAKQACVLTRAIQLRIGRAMLGADLGLPSRPHGIVLFAHDLGADRFCPVEQAIACEVRRGGIATLSTDLVARNEPAPPADPAGAAKALAQRILGIVDWCWREPQLRGLPVGLFGVGIGGTAALLAAAERGENIKAVVVRNARTDILPPDTLPRITAATLFIIAGDDRATLDANAEAVEEIAGPRDLHIVDRASPRFTEPGAPEDAAQRTRQWLLRHLPKLR